MVVSGALVTVIAAVLLPSMRRGFLLPARSCDRGAPGSRRWELTPGSPQLARPLPNFSPLGGALRSTAMNHDQDASPDRSDSCDH